MPACAKDFSISTDRQSESPGIWRMKGFEGGCRSTEARFGGVVCGRGYENGDLDEGGGVGRGGGRRGEGLEG